MADLSKFNVIYKERVYKAVELYNLVFKENEDPIKVDFCVPKMLSVIAVDENCRLVILTDEAWMFQFVTIVQPN